MDSFKEANVLKNLYLFFLIIKNYGMFKHNRDLLVDTSVLILLKCLNNLGLFKIIGIYWSKKSWDKIHKIKLIMMKIIPLITMNP